VAPLLTVTHFAFPPITHHLVPSLCAPRPEMSFRNVRSDALDLKLNINAHDIPTPPANPKHAPLVPLEALPRSHAGRTSRLDAAPRSGVVAVAAHLSPFTARLALHLTDPNSHCPAVTNTLSPPKPRHARPRRCSPLYPTCRLSPLLSLYTPLLPRPLALTRKSARLTLRAPAAALARTGSSP
jgi:hypothetical protein